MNKPDLGNHVSMSKLRFLVFGIFIFFGFVIVFLVRWQIVDYERFTIMAASRFQRKEIPALRGDILARDGSVLAYSEPRFDIFVYKDDQHGLLAAENADRQTRTEFLEKVSQILEISEDDLKERLEIKSKWINIAQSVTREQRDLLMNIPTNKDSDIFLDGISYEDSSERIYPEGELASHLLGFIGSNDYGEVLGRSGLEQYYDGILKPQVGVNSSETDSNSNVIALSNNLNKEARRGASIKTTIDKNIQVKVEKILAEKVAEFDAEHGTVIIIDPRTGEILSMANFPDFDPNYYYQVEDSDILGNTAVTTPYEIGSVGKIFTMAAAVDQGKVLPNTIVINGHEGCRKIVDQKVICTYDKQPQGSLTATEAMIKSDNLALFATGELVGQEKLSDYLENFGIGKKTKVQLSAEDSGYIKQGRLWNEADLATYSYGHSYFQTAIQSAFGVGALANSGKRMQPLLVTELIEANGEKRVYTPKVIAEVITPKSSEIMAQILHEVYLNNLFEDKYKHLAEYNIGMKSGTALIPFSSLAESVDKAGYSNEVNSTYVGYDASEKNTFLMLVNVSEPQTNPKLSFNNARFLWLDIFEEIKDDLGVPKK